MKEITKTAIVFTLLVIAIPSLAFFRKPPADDTEENVTVQETVQEEQTAAEEKKYAGNEEFSVLDFTSGQVMKMTMTEYVRGAVLAEMPASFHSEALKAQAVAAHTYAVRQKEKQLIAPDEELMGAYISNDSSKYQAFFTDAQAKAFYGTGYDAYSGKVNEAVNAVIDEILVYNDEPIVAAFHSVSSGKTESAEVVWGNPVAYLVPVESSDDIKSPSYYGEGIFTSDEISARFGNAYGGIEFSGEKEDWFKINSVSTSGTVIKLTAGGTELSGAEVRRILSLKSACFEVSYDGKSDCFTFSTTGNGHGVGLSQYGANAMAEKGSTYDEILLYYYNGARLIKIN